MISIKKYSGTLIAFCGVLVLGLGLYRLDPLLLVRHQVGEGRVSGIYTDPHQLPGGRSMNNYYPDLYYTYTDAGGEHYRSKASVMLGYEEPGDTFVVLYDPDKPARHLPLTGFGVALPVTLLAIGALIIVHGLRDRLPALHVQNARRDCRPQDHSMHYAHTWQARPLVAWLVGPFVVVLLYGMKLRDTPWLIRIVMGIIALIAALAGLGALMSTTVVIDNTGVVTVRRKIGGIPFSTSRVDAAQVMAVELGRRVTSGLDGSGGVASTRRSSRVRIDLRLADGLVSVAASAEEGGFQYEAARIAKALNRPLEKVGDWRPGA